MVLMLLSVAHTLVCNSCPFPLIRMEKSRSAFRHLLKGVSDGDLLLDSNFNICGNASCLQRLLGTHEDFNGRNFLDLITEPGSVPFSKFLVAEGGGSSASATPGSKCPNMPQGVRVHLQGSGCEVPVDVFHVVLPELYGTSATHHLLAIMEHSEPCVRSVRSEPRQGAAPASLPEGKEGKEDVFTESHERGSEDMDASHMVQQFAEQLAQQFNVLSDLTLLVNANTELIDIEEAVMHFAHNDAVEMTSLNGLVPPREWHGIKSKLHQFARATRSRRPKPSSLPSMVLRFPGQEEDTYLRARRVSIEPVYSATFHEAEPTLVCPGCEMCWCLLLVWKLIKCELLHLQVLAPEQIQHLAPNCGRGGDAKAT